jgi:hypothetical protein
MIRNTDAINFDFNKSHYDLREHEEREMPEALAVLMICKKQARIV